MSRAAFTWGIEKKMKSKEKSSRERIMRRPACSEGVWKWRDKMFVGKNNEDLYVMSEDR